MFKILRKKNVDLNSKVDQGWPIGRWHRPIDRQVSFG